jgi:hypothetical protein
MGNREGKMTPRAIERCGKECRKSEKDDDEKTRGGMKKAEESAVKLCDGEEA